MASLISLIFTLTVLPVIAFSLYCDYVQLKDCYHEPDLKHVCGTNGKTYRNYCLLAKAYCQDNTIHKSHDGDCLSVGATPNQVNGSEIALDIFCMDLSYYDCPVVGPQVCATNGKTYPSMCEFEKARCTHREIHMNGTGAAC